MENISFELWEQTSETVRYHTFLPFGACAEIKNYSSPIYIGSAQPLQVYFTDPYHQSYYRVEKNAMPDDPVRLQARNDGVNDDFRYKIHLVLVKKVEGQTDCRNYENPSDYADCVHLSMKEKFITLLGKIPNIKVSFIN